MLAFYPRDIEKKFYINDKEVEEEFTTLTGFLTSLAEAMTQIDPNGYLAQIEFIQDYAVKCAGKKILFSDGSSFRMSVKYLTACLMAFADDFNEEFFSCPTSRKIFKETQHFKYIYA